MVNETPCGVNATVVVLVPGDASGIVNITVDGKRYSSNVSDGRAVFTLPLLDCGSYVVDAFYCGDDVYNSNSNQSSFKVVPVENYDEVINVSSVDGKIVVDVSLPADATGNVTIFVNNESVVVPVVNGKASFSVDAPTGENNVTVVYSGDNKYASKTSGASVVNTKKSTILSAEILIMNEGDDNAYLKTVLKDTDGNPVVGRGIKLNIIGKVYTAVTDKNGVGLFPIALKHGLYSASVVFKGDNEYYASNVVPTRVEVYTKIRIDQNRDIEKDYHDDSVPFSVRALDKYGKPVGAGEIVKMTVSGKTYTLKTNEKGIATLPINLYPGKYVITSVFAGYKVYNNIYIRNIIHATNRQWDAGSPFSYFTATLKYSNGKVLAGKTVVFTVAGKTYNVVTNAKGEATVILKNLAVGKYTIQVKYIQYFIKRSITVK